MQEAVIFWPPFASADHSSAILELLSSFSSNSEALVKGCVLSEGYMFIMRLVDIWYWFQSYIYMVCGWIPACTLVCFGNDREVSGVAVFMIATFRLETEYKKWSGRSWFFLACARKLIFGNLAEGIKRIFAYFVWESLTFLTESLSLFLLMTSESPVL